MKKVLFVLQSIGYGGSMTSMINLLRFLKQDRRIEIDVQFLDRYGELFDEAETVSHVLDEDKLLQSVTMRREKILANKRYDLYLRRCLFAFLGKLKRVPTTTIAYRKAALQYSNRYDCVIAFQEGIATNFVKYIDAPCKIAWIHTEYDRLVKLYQSIDEVKSTYAAFTKMVCVSKSCEMHIKDEISTNVCCIHNVVPVDALYAKAKEDIHKIADVNYIDVYGKRQWKFISSGRFSKEKRFDRAVDVAEQLKNYGVDFIWTILGRGEETQAIQELIKRKSLDDCMYLPGAVKNPFPLVASSDVFVLTSDYEAQPMVANEALILGIPVVTTNFESATEVVSHEENGLICGMDVMSIFESLLSLVNDKDRYLGIVEGARKFVYRNDEIIESVKKLIMEG